MRNIDILESFELEINLLDDNINKPATSDSEFWLNKGLEKFWKTRYSGINNKGRGFEQDQKRVDDLRTLVTVKYYESTNAISNSEYSIELPKDYLLLLGDTASILPLDNSCNKCWSTDEKGRYIPRKTDTLEATIETIDRQLENSLSEHRLKYCQARPLRLIRGNNVYLYTDGHYQVSAYDLTYLRKPQNINIHSYPYDEYTDMPEHTISEIVRLAAKMYIENQKDPRINTYSQEINEME